MSHVTSFYTCYMPLVTSLLHINCYMLLSSSLAKSAAPAPCRHTISGLFHSPCGVLFTFPSRYLSTIDRTSYLALEGGPPGFGQGYTCPDLLETTRIKSHDFRVRGYHPLWRSVPESSANYGDL